MERGNTWLKIALAFAIIGAVNWGLVGLFEFNLVDAIFGAGSAFSRVIYTIVGLAGLACLSLFGYRFVGAEAARVSPGHRAEVRP